jgi:hypothetical protein
MYEWNFIIYPVLYTNRSCRAGMMTFWDKVLQKASVSEIWKHWEREALSEYDQKSPPNSKFSLNIVIIN